MEARLASEQILAPGPTRGVDEFSAIFPSTGNLGRYLHTRFFPHFSADSADFFKITFRRFL